MDNTKITDDLLIDELKKRIDKKNQALKELTELTKELKTVNKKLAESEALKSHFISNITNEIINPFASILGLSKNIMKVEDCKCERVKKMAQLIFNEAFNLDFQLKNIFCAAEIEAGDIYPQISNIDLNELIINAIKLFKPNADKKQISILFKDEIRKDGKNLIFKSDPEKLEIILTNLLDNAIKYSSATGKIEIRAWQKKELLNISVKDHGIGISEQNQKIIFDRFRRLDSGINSINRGHGLGLSVIKALLDLLDGKIEINSRPKNGATFIISLPEAEVPEGFSDFSSSGNEIFFGNDEIF